MSAERLPDPGMGRQPNSTGSLPPINLPSMNSVNRPLQPNGPARATRALPPLDADAAQQPAAHSGHYAQPYPPDSSPSVGASTSARSRTTHPAAMHARSQARTVASPPPKTWGPHEMPPPIGVHELIGELLGQNSLLEARLTSTTSDSPEARAPPVKLCDVCDETDDEPRRRAVFYCEDCRRLGFPHEFCEPCWTDEHRSKRTRDHRRAPLPLVSHHTIVGQHTSTSSTASISDPAPATQNAIDVRALLTLQQHVLQLLQHIAPKQAQHCGSQTTEGDFSTPRGQASSSVATAVPAAASDSRATRDLEVTEYIARVELTNTALRELLTLSLRHERFYVVVAQILRPSPLPSMSGTTTIVRPELHSAGVQATPTHGRQRTTSQAEDLVVFVHGEKHLPGQPQMLLVKFASGAEDWVEAAAVQHHEEVRLYLHRKFTPEPGRHSRVLHSAEGYYEDAVQERVLGDTERLELQAQLASLKRLGTAGSAATASRGSMLGDDPLPPPPPDARLDGDASPVNDDELGDTEAEDNEGTAGDDAAPIEGDDESPSAPPKSDSKVSFEENASAEDEQVVRKYEQRVRALEERQQQVRRMREEQEQRLKQLRERQQVKDEAGRQRVHTEYEAQQAALQREQPDVQHPLYQTNDRHAALLLHKLNEEIAQAEKERAYRNEYRSLRQRKASRPDEGLDGLTRPADAETPGPDAGLSSNEASPNSTTATPQPGVGVTALDNPEHNDE